MKKIIVLVTSGHHENVDFVQVFLFNTKDEADDFCEKMTLKDRSKKYWCYAEKIEDGNVYEPLRYENISNI